MVQRLYKLFVIVLTWFLTLKDGLLLLICKVRLQRTVVSVPKIQGRKKTTRCLFPVYRWFVLEGMYSMDGISSSTNIYHTFHPFQQNALLSIHWLVDYTLVYFASHRWLLYRRGGELEEYKYCDMTLFTFPDYFDFVNKSETRSSLPTSPAPWTTKDKLRNLIIKTSTPQIPSNSIWT